MTAGEKLVWGLIVFGLLASLWAWVSLRLAAVRDRQMRAAEAQRRARQAAMSRHPSVQSVGDEAEAFLRQVTR